MTLRSLLAQTQERLESSNLENAEAESRWILADLLGIDAANLVDHLERNVQVAEISWIDRAVSKRKDRVPLQYILGTVEFLDLTLKVTPSVLIPRPETEWLVDTVCYRLAQTPPTSVLDIGLGSGAIAIAIASRFSSAKVTGVDISSDALLLARQNISLNDIQRLDLTQGSLHALPFSPTSFDLIISNPPYIRSEDMAGLAPEVIQHEPSLALDGGPDGLKCYRSVAQESARLLKPGGTVAIELPGHPPEAVSELFIASGFSQGDILNDLTDKPRLFLSQLST